MAAADPPVPPGVDPAIPSPARLYDYFLGGRHNYPAEQGARQFIDLGSGLPRASNTHQIVRGVAPAADRWDIVARYLGALAPGSYLVLSHGTADRLPPRAVQAMREEYAKATENIFLHPRAKVERFFRGLELVPPYEAAVPESATSASGEPWIPGSLTATDHGCSMAGSADDHDDRGRWCDRQADG